MPGTASLGDGGIPFGGVTNGGATVTPPPSFLGLPVVSTGGRLVFIFDVPAPVALSGEVVQAASSVSGRLGVRLAVGIDGATGVWHRVAGRLRVARLDVDLDVLLDDYIDDSLSD